MAELNSPCALMSVSRLLRADSALPLFPRHQQPPFMPMLLYLPFLPSSSLEVPAAGRALQRGQGASSAGCLLPARGMERSRPQPPRSKPMVHSPASALERPRPHAGPNARHSLRLSSRIGFIAMALMSQPTGGGSHRCWVSSTQTPAPFHRVVQPLSHLPPTAPCVIALSAPVASPSSHHDATTSTLLCPPSPLRPLPLRGLVAAAGLCAQAGCCCLSAHKKDLVVGASQSPLSFSSGGGRLHLWIRLASCSRRRL